MWALNLTAKAYETKISAELQRFQAGTYELEARVRGEMAQGVIDTIHHLKAQKQLIERKCQALRASGDAKFGQLKAEIDPEVGKANKMTRQSTKAARERGAQAGWDTK